MDFISLTKVRLLLCPGGRIKQHKFHAFYERLKSCSSVRLGDISPDADENKTFFTPQAFPNGQIRYHPLILPDREHEYLEDFEPHRRVWIVVLLFDGSEDNSKEAILESISMMEKHYPRAILVRAIVFERSHLEWLESRPNEIIAVRSDRASDISAMRTAMAELSTFYLANLSLHLQKLREASSFESPVEPDSQNSGSWFPSREHTSTPIERPDSAASNSSSVRDRPVSTILPLDRRRANKGRLSKITANLLLLAGRISDAHKDFTEAVSSCRASNDHVWHASSLQGLAVCVVILSSMKIAVNVIPSNPHTSAHVAETLTPPSQASRSRSPAIPEETRKSSAGLADTISEILKSAASYYTRGYGENVPQIILCELYIDLSWFLACLYLARGWNEKAIAILMSDRQPDSKISFPSGSSSDLSLAEISNWAMEAHGDRLLRTSTTERAYILGKICTVLDVVGMRRKRAMIMKELIEAIIPELVNGRVADAAQLGIHPSGNFTSRGSVGAGAGATTREDVLKLLYNLSAAYKINTKNSSPFVNEPSGWMLLKTAVLRAIINFCEAIGDAKSLLQFTSILLTTSARDLNVEEQGRLASLISRTVASASNRGMTLEVDYWDPFLVRDVTLVPSSDTSIPVLHQRDDLIQNEKANAVKDPFIYNPFVRKAAAKTVIKLVQDERVLFKIKLQNPHSFEVEVRSLTLATEGAELVSDPVQCILGANKVQEISMYGTPTKQGVLKILGCNVRIFRCRESFYRIFSAPWKIQLKVMASTRNKRLSYDKLQGMDMHHHTLGHCKELEYSVLGEIPFAKVVSSSLVDDSIMLLEGEKKMFTLSLRNMTKHEIDFVLLSFVDSTIQPLQEALSSTNLLPNEIHELEYFLYKRRSLSWKQSSNDKAQILSFSDATFDIEVVSKRGLNEAVIQVDYGYLGDKTVPAQEFYTRQLKIPILLTVNASVEMTGCDIIASTESLRQIHKPTMSHMLTDLANLGAYALLILDFRNIWPHLIEIEVCVKDVLCQSERIEAGHTLRMILPFRRLSISSQKLMEPIPALSERQFVVSKVPMTKEQESQIRETFWFREAVLERLHGTWKVPEGDRHGAVEMRGLRLSPRMIDHVRAEDICIHLSIKDANIHEGKYGVGVDAFVELHALITNHLDHPVTPLLVLRPYLTGQDEGSTDLTRYMSFNGLLQQPLPALPANEAQVHKLGVVFLAAGEYGWAASVEEMSEQGQWRVHPCRDPLTVKCV